jgi:SNF family Na+-dependent transporter
MTVDRYFVVTLFATLSVLITGEAIGWAGVAAFLNKWQTLVAGVLALSGALLVLVAARWAANARAATDELSKLRAARMRLAAHLQFMAHRYIRIFFDFANFFLHAGRYCEAHVSAKIGGRLPRPRSTPSTASMNSPV